MHGLLLIARFIHILCGAYWVGAVFFLNIFVGPSLQAAGPSGMAVMKALTERKYFEFTVGMATLSILAGLYLVYQDSVGFDPAWFRTSFGMAISTGMATAILTLLLGIFLFKPALNTLGAVGMRLAQATDQTRSAVTVEMDAARKRVMGIGLVGTLLLVITIATMSVARYL